MNNSNWTGNVTGTMTQSGNGIVFGVRASGAYAPSVMDIPCSLAGAFIDGQTPKRHVDVAFEQHPGTPVWSPST